MVELGKAQSLLYHRRKNIQPEIDRDFPETGKRRIPMKDGKLFGKINIIDLLVVLIDIFVVVMVALKWP